MSPSTKIAFMVLLGVFVAARVVAGAHPLGLVLNGEERSFDLIYRNSTQAAQGISEVVPDCSCITILGYPPAVAPGEVVTIPCIYKAERTGAILAHVELRSAEGAKGFAKLVVRGFVVESDWVIPPAKLRTAPALLVDVRDERAYSSARISGAVHIPWYALPARAQLKARPIVVYDAGFDSCDLAKTVWELRTAGFVSVAMLEGGLAAWAASGGAWEGEPMPSLNLITLSAAEFARASINSPWTVVLVGKPSTPLDFGMAVHRAENAAAAIAFLEDEARNSAAGKDRLLVAENPAVYAVLERSLTPVQRLRTRFLKGGPDAWRAHVRISQEAAANDGSFHRMIHKASARSNHVPGCGSCGK
jgi:rhodanese-related sulfurtransferase